MKKSSMLLTEGNVFTKIIAFALPILIGQIFQNLYNSVDSIVVGRFVGTTALAAVTSCSDISQLLVGFFTGLSTGSGVLFSKFFGAGDKKNLHDSIHTAVCFAGIIGFLMAALGIILTPVLLNIVACPADVYAESERYLRIYLIGVLFTSIYNIGAGVLRAVGDSRSPLYFLIISSVTNVILDLLFVALFDMGVMGVAVATIISQLISVILVFRKMIKTNDVYKFSFKDLKIDKALLLKVLDLGLPAAIQTSIICISNLFVQRYINSFGSLAMAGIGSAKKIDKFVGMIAQSLGLSASTFVGQNVGARDFKRAFKGVRVCIFVSLAFVAIMGTTIYFFAPVFVRLFTNDESAVTYGVAMIHVMMPFYGFQALNAVFANVVRGFGKSRVVMLCSVGGMVVCRQIFLAITMGIQWKVEFVYAGYPFGWAMAGLSTLAYYLFYVKPVHVPRLMKEE